MSGISKSQRAGWSLVELLVVMPLLAVLLSSSAILLTAVFRSQGSLSIDIQQQSSRARLAMQLRRDAHAARSVQCNSPQSCDLSLAAEETVHYEIKEATLHRELRRNDVVQQRETFPLTGLHAEFSLDQTGELSLIRLHLISTPEPGKYAAVARSAVLEAAVGIERASSKQASKP